jgi:predicted CoA-substrate-specific enzyme activase
VIAAIGPGLVGGVDVGAQWTRALCVDRGGRILARAKVRTGANFADAAERAWKEAIKDGDLDPRALLYVASTGFGRYKVAFRDVQVTEVTSHGRGARALFPRAHRAIDIGAQTTRALRIEPSGRVAAFRLNDKCAAGAGRFVERAAKSLELTLEEAGPTALRAQSPVTISSICAVLAESEIINHVTEGAHPADILAGVFDAIASRAAQLLRRVGGSGPVALTGGSAENPGLVQALSHTLDGMVEVHPDSAWAGALGAALLGWTRVEKKAA